MSSTRLLQLQEALLSTLLQLQPFLDSVTTTAVGKFVFTFPFHAAFAAVTAIFLMGVASEVIRPSTVYSFKGLGHVGAGQKFVAKKVLSIKDALLVSFLGEELEQGKKPCYVITDPDLPDNPIIYASEGFCKFTGYSKEEVENRNCRFLQGKHTKELDRTAIRDGIAAELEVSVQLLNYKKDGKEFINQFFLCPLRNHAQKVVYYVGVQKEVQAVGDKQDGANEGWRLFMYF